MLTHATAPTLHIEANGVNFAYRRFGAPGTLPLVMLQHFTGGLDHWDPLITDGFAKDREVILVNYPGIGASSGETPKTIELMAQSIDDFIMALGLETFDLLGFSIGGMVAQAYAKEHSSKLRKLILVGTSPRGGEPTPFQEEVVKRARGNAGLEELAWLFFGHSEAGRAAAGRFWERRHSRTLEVDPPSRQESIVSQAIAGHDWLVPHGERFADLKKISVPTLVVNGTLDVMLPTINSFYLQQNIPDAQLIIYPDAGHAPHFQFPGLFLAHANLFLEG
ncbi:alpha/beta hydrolase [Novosphingobium sp.]|uniref:alpha/beta fold hydrolase n=1 Tax=Novosphingobium sp. TaxID=1874826 RepID=UPI0031E2F198